MQMWTCWRNQQLPHLLLRVARTSPWLFKELREKTQTPDIQLEGLE